MINSKILDLEERLGELFADKRELEAQIQEVEAELEKVKQNGN
jgi:predicted nuclease with TOPRIM domain